MALKQVYVVMDREKGLFLVEPVPGKGQHETVEAALGLQGGYSAGLVELDLPADQGEMWLAWVEVELPDGSPYFEYRVYEGSLTEQQVLAQAGAAGEEPLKLNRTVIHRATFPAGA